MFCPTGPQSRSSACVRSQVVPSMQLRGAQTACQHWTNLCAFGRLGVPAARWLRLCRARRLPFVDAATDTGVLPCPSPGETQSHASLKCLVLAGRSIDEPIESVHINTDGHLDDLSLTILIPPSCVPKPSRHSNSLSRYNDGPFQCSFGVDLLEKARDSPFAMSRPTARVHFGLFSEG